MVGEVAQTVAVRSRAADQHEPESGSMKNINFLQTVDGDRERIGICHYRILD